MDMDGNNTLQIKAIRVVISTFETLPVGHEYPAYNHRDLDAMTCPVGGSIPLVCSASILAVERRVGPLFASPDVTQIGGLLQAHASSNSPTSVNYKI